MTRCSWVQLVLSGMCAALPLLPTPRPPHPHSQCSIDDASKAMAACQEQRLDSQPDHPLRISYARDRFAGDPHYQQVGGRPVPLTVC